MKRIRIVGLCLVAVFAMAAVAASAAQAAPTYFTCVKAAKEGKTYTGKYTAKGCTNASKVETGGKYERASAVGVTMKSKSGTATLSTPDLGGKVVCSKSKGTGKVTGASTDEQLVEFEKCTSEGKKCTSSGAKAGDIVTKPLATELVGSESAPEDRFTAIGGSGNYQAEFDCEGLLIRTKGFTDGLITSPAAGTASKSSTVTFEGEENLRTEVSIDGGAEWIGSEFGGFPSEEKVTASVKNSAELGTT